MKKKLLLLLPAALTIGVAYFYFRLYPQLPIADGYAARKMCSCTFIAGRSQESIQETDLGFGPLSMTRTRIDRDSGSAVTTLFGMAPRTAVYRGDVGCILLSGKDDNGISLSIDRPVLPDTLLWPRGTSLAYPAPPQGVDMEKLNAAVRNAFDPGMAMSSKKTRAVVVVHEGRLLAEAYAPGFDAQTEILGWSMTKSITGTMIGILVKNKVLSLEDTGIFPGWTDDRKRISLEDMLRMQSGLAFTEDYGSVSDATRMLFTSEDVSAIPGSKPLVNEPGAYWSYSSGTSNLLSRLVRDRLGSEKAYLHFPYDSIFNRIGMTSAVMETDESGTFIGSSYCYATPRDWAKFGLLYLNGGNWFGDQVVDTSWVDFVRTPASHSDGIYGGHFWLNAGRHSLPDAPEDLFSCNGFQGQYVFIIPSYGLVVVRMGLAEEPDFDPNGFLKEILESFDQFFEKTN